MVGRSAATAGANTSFLPPRQTIHLHSARLPLTYRTECPILRAKRARYPLTAGDGCFPQQFAEHSAETTGQFLLTRKFPRLTCRFQRLVRYRKFVRRSALPVSNAMFLHRLRSHSRRRSTRNV